MIFDNLFCRTPPLQNGCGRPSSKRRLNPLSVSLGQIHLVPGLSGQRIVLEVLVNKLKQAHIPLVGDKGVVGREVDVFHIPQGIVGA